MSTAPEALAGRFPPLMVAAARVAATVAQGVHGRRRVGVGDTFWQYRHFIEGDAASRIDWRRSARSDRTYVRDMEWEAAQTVLLWRDASPSMAWRSGRALPEKRERADLLLLALATLLFRAGEQVRLLGAARTFRGRGGLAPLAAALAAAPAALPAAAVPAHARVVLIGDFLEDPTVLRARLAALAQQRVRGDLVQVLDPAEIALPYQGRIRFTGLEGEGSTLLARTEALRPAYAQAFAAHQQAIDEAARGVGFRVHRHSTEAPPESALMALYVALSEAS